MTTNDDAPKKRGFAAMDPEKHRAICSKGGKAAQAKGTGHQYTPEEARAAGEKGGAATAKDREHMSRIGKLGGKASHAARKGSRGTT